MRTKSLADFGLPVELAEAHAPVVLFDKVNLAFDEKVILRDVTFSVRAGHTKIFLGASGAGKSTILKLMLGLLKPDSGTIWVLGHRVDLMSEARADGRPASHGHGLPGRRALRFVHGRRERRLQALRRDRACRSTRSEQRVEEVLGFVGLGAHIDKLPSALSGGQRRRVAIARAMAARPTLLLYDEATTGLDPMTALTVDAEIVKLRDLERVTSVLVTHQLRDAFYVATHEARRGADRRASRSSKPAQAKIEEADFVMIREGQVVVRRRRPRSCAARKDPYLQTFLS